MTQSILHNRSILKSDWMSIWSHYKKFHIHFTAEIKAAWTQY